MCYREKDRQEEVKFTNKENKLTQEDPFRVAAKDKRRGEARHKAREA